MWNLFQFPKKFEVNKKLDKDIFLRNANLTEEERRHIQDFMVTTNVLYDIVFNDKSEMVILHSELKYIPKINYFLYNYAYAIAKSLPYRCLLVLQCEGVIKIVTFIEHTNTQDNRRMAVDGYRASKEIIMCKNDYFDKFIYEDLRNCISDAVSAKDLSLRWYNVFSDSVPLEENIFNESIKQRNLIQSNNALLDLSINENGNVHNTDDWHDEFINSASIIDFENEPFDCYFLEFCADACRCLYNEAQSLQDVELAEYCGYDTKINETKWIVDFVEACNEYAHLIMNKELGINAICYIRENFYNNTTQRDVGYYDDFDMEYLKQYLWKYFDCIGDEYV